MNFIEKISNLYKRKILRTDKDRWNYQYNLGRWEGLGALEELSRFSIIVGYSQHFKPEGKILEYGAGEGYLQQRFDKSKYSLYYSTDVSDVAIDNAQKYNDHKTQHLIADMNTYDPSIKFDVIIINEAVYYGHSVQAILDRCANYLNDDGIFIVSINHDDRNAKWHKMMDECTFPKIDKSTVTTARNTFTITVLGK